MYDINVIIIYVYPFFLININICSSIQMCYLSSNMASDHIIYLTNTGSKNLFPENNPGKFTNRLSTPIILDSNIEYEIGLVSILYPDQYYAILANDDNYNITLHTIQKGIKRAKLQIKIGKYILAGNIEKIIKIVNENMMQYMQAYYHEFFPYLFSNDESIFKWNNNERKVEISSKIGDPKQKITEDFIEISLQINEGLASIFGFRSNQLYTIYNNKGNNEIHRSIVPPSPRCGVDYIYLYTDIIQPSNFGGQLVNILDCFTLQNGGNKGIHNSIYKLLNTSFIDQISIIITDQNGRSIHFPDESTITCVLHIRPK